MNSPINTKTMTGTPCSCAGAAPAGKSCGCGGGCGGDTCQVDILSRPRFFAGQLLTEDDLQSLEDYVLAKNRLHNRHLFGSGIVCGFQVLCNPCGGGSVTVMPGYALDCCGNDIALDCQLSLDINAMVRALKRDQLGGYDCGDPCTEQQQSLDGTVAPPREYALYVRYCEQDSDPVSPYAVGEPCSAQTCEMSRVREGLRFELRCPQDLAPEASLGQAILDCFSTTIGIERADIYADGFSINDYVDAANAKLDELSKSSFEDLRQRLLDLLDRSPCQVDCQLRAKVLAAQPPTDEQLRDQQTGAIGGKDGDNDYNRALTDIYLEILVECACMALTPPCAPCADMGVLLAGIKVQNCAVVEICNMKRHFVMAPTALRYWSSFGFIEKTLAALCCSPLPQQREDGRTGLGDLRAVEALPAAAPAAAPQAQPAVMQNLKAMAMTMASMSPAVSARLANAGVPLTARAAPAAAMATAQPAPPPPPAVDDIVQQKVAEAMAPHLAQMTQSLKQVDALKKQVADLTTKLNAKPAARKPTGGGR